MPNISVKTHSPIPEPIGKRIAYLRAERGWTQNELASRLAMSRVAISHIEMDLTLPSERTVILLSGLFKLNPQDLVKGTTYPQAKSERLPEITCIYRQLELTLALFRNDQEWLTRLGDSQEECKLALTVLMNWSAKLEELIRSTVGERERSPLEAALQDLRRFHDQFS